jgi:hypothetical protein
MTNQIRVEMCAATKGQCCYCQPGSCSHRYVGIEKLPPINKERKADVPDTNVVKISKKGNGMQIKDLLVLMHDTERVRIYTDDEEPDFEGFCKDAPWWLADCEIYPGSDVGIEDGKYIAMNAKIV